MNEQQNILHLPALVQKPIYEQYDFEKQKNPTTWALEQCILSRNNSKCLRQAAASHPDSVGHLRIAARPDGRLLHPVPQIPKPSEVLVSGSAKHPGTNRRVSKGPRPIHLRGLGQGRFTEGGLLGLRVNYFYSRKGAR